MKLFTLLLLVAAHTTKITAFQTTPKLINPVPLITKTNNNHNSINKNSIPTKTNHFHKHHGALHMASSSTSSNEKLEIDTSAIAKYLTAIIAQVSLLSASLYMLDLGQDPARGMSAFPTPAIFLIFYFLSLRSRIFNALDNRRPDLKQLGEESQTTGFRDRVMPGWTPPGVFFPIMWILIISPLRSYSSYLIYQANGGHFFDPTIIALMLHLSIGDTWNTINNVERRVGAAVVGVSAVLASAANAAYQYYLVDETAGKALGATCIWLTVATFLVGDTWRLNPREDGRLDAFYPVKGDAETRFFFEEGER